METKTETEQSSEEAEVVTEETPAASKPVQEPTVPLHDHTALRSKLQDERVANARLQGQLDAQAAQQAKRAPAAISPLDAEEARQREEGIPDDEMTISPAIIRADKLYDQQLANQAAETAAKQNHEASQRASARTFALVHDDYAEVVRQGMSHLSKYQEAEILDAGADFGEKSYNMCKKAIEASKPAPEPSEQTETEKLAAEAKAKEEANKKAEANKQPGSRDAILAGVSDSTARVMNL